MYTGKKVVFTLHPPTSPPVHNTTLHYVALYLSGSFHTHMWGCLALHRIITGVFYCPVSSAGYFY
jgi:hypothetical protein